MLQRPSFSGFTSAAKKPGSVTAQLSTFSRRSRASKDAQSPSLGGRRQRVLELQHSAATSASRRLHNHHRSDAPHLSVLPSPDARHARPFLASERTHL
ncbi:hypothetical protein HPB50_025001 [Hyalomma asiaticum]|uniref:Uncharacterized protein n=1 Tax=Hyalomma asiaticum TaxID=266040 RepID=A0ACB7T1K0_HYAAI|nr:hypothetical protein HPB50_025001 [Hyalomma asiaticum]